MQNQPKPKFYVYSGTRNSDNYDQLTHTLEVFDSEQEVLDFHKTFTQGLTKEDSDIEFRVILGTEFKITPVETVVSYRLSQE